MFATIKKLSLFDWYIFIRTLTLMCFVRILLGTIKYQKTRNFFKRPVAKKQSRDIEELLMGIRIAERRFPKKNCLTVAIAVERILAAYGFNCTLHMGAGKKANDMLHGHAWVKYNGQIIVGWYEGIEKLKEFPI